MSARVPYPKEALPIAEVVLLRYFDRVFHYFVPEDIRDKLRPGMRVLVPFRNEWLTGIVTRRLRQADAAPVKLKPVLELLDSSPVLDRPMMALTRWLSDYYLTGWGLAMKTVLPPGLELKVGSLFRITEAGRRASENSGHGGGPGWNLLKRLSAASRGLRLEALLRRPADKVRSNRTRRDGGRRSSGALAALIKKGWVEETRVLPRGRSAIPLEKDSCGTKTPPHYPNRLGAAASRPPAAPESVIQSVRLGRFEVYCVEGDRDRSGSVSLAALLESVRSGRSAIVLVPEIDRVSEWTQLLKEKYGLEVGALHSELSDSRRRDEWARARRGERSIIVGTRMAVFAPVPNLGLIVVENEQDPSYKQEESPRYHARDVAVLRASHEGALAILTASSPSVETYANIQSGKYRSIPLSDPSVGHGTRPPVTVVNMAGRSRGIFISDELITAVQAKLDQKEPVVLILNRKGFGTALYCRDCGAVCRCPRCQVAMAYSKKFQALICHYCGAKVIPPSACPQCRGTHLGIIGVGTEQVEEFLASRFSGARIERLDRDSARPEDVRAAIERLNGAETHVVIGTQFLLKGPRMKRPGLVGLLQADGAFYHPDFRAGEQTFQLVRAVLDFSAEKGEVMIQTVYPDHESIAWAVAGGPGLFYEKELAARKVLGYPPFSRLAVVTVKAFDKSKAEAVAQRLSERLRNSIQTQERLPTYQILGPAQSMHPRLHGKFRYQILIKAPDSHTLHAALQSGLKAIRSGPGQSRVWFEVDVDPQRIA
jgi:primosomal protein N' (replication factor Y) (superfamily II helicase)